MTNNDFPLSLTKAYQGVLGRCPREHTRHFYDFLYASTLMMISISFVLAAILYDSSPTIAGVWVFGDILFP